MSNLEPSLQSNAAPVLADVASAVNDNLVNAEPLSPNPGSDAITAGADRKLGLESSGRKVDDLLKSHASGMTPEERDKKIESLMGTLARTSPMPNQAPKVAEEAAETMRRLVKAVMDAIKSMFKLGGKDPENDSGGEGSQPIWMIGRSQHASGFGMLHDQLKELMDQKESEFEGAAKNATKAHDKGLDSENLNTPDMGVRK